MGQVRQGFFVLDTIPERSPRARMVSNPEKASPSNVGALPGVSRKGSARLSRSCGALSAFLEASEPLFVCSVARAYQTERAFARRVYSPVDKNYVKSRRNSRLATNAQVRSAGPQMIAFLAPLLTGSDRSCRDLGRLRARLLEEDPAKKGSQYGELFARLLRPRKNMTMPTAYPSPDLAWHYAWVLRRRGDDWLSGPLMLYAVGQLPAFVDVIYHANFNQISPGRLLRLLEQLPKAVAGSTPAREQWDLSFSEQSAFSSPSTLPKPSARGLPDSILLAKSVARDFGLPYDLQRRQVLKHLQEWLAPLARDQDI